VGLYLALTGARVKGHENKSLGICTHFIKAQNLPLLSQKLENINRKEEIDDVLKELEDNNNNKNFSEESEIIKNLDTIKKCFDENLKDVEDIVDALEKIQNHNEFAKKTLKSLKAMSPTSLKVVFKQLHNGKKMSLRECFIMELRLVERFMMGNDFYEGIRAQLIDKTRDPKWKPGSVKEVKDSDIQKYFLPLQHELKLP